MSGSTSMWRVVADGRGGFRQVLASGECPAAVVPSAGAEARAAVVQPAEDVPGLRDRLEAAQSAARAAALRMRQADGEVRRALDEVKFLREQLNLALGREVFLHRQLSERTAAETQLRIMLAAASRPAIEATPAEPEPRQTRQVVTRWFRTRWWKAAVVTSLLAALAGGALFLAADHSFAGDTPVHHGRAPH
jgi:hypothetical protein